MGKGPATKVKGTVRAENVDVTGGDPAAIKKVVAGYNAQIKSCYEERLKSDPTLGGRVEMMWTVTSGRVTSVSVVANTTGDAELAKCIAGRIRGWRFPVLEEESTEVIFPFILAPG